VLHENDIDCPVAQALAAEVITEKAFEPISESVCSRALETLGNCERVICCPSRFGTMNQKNFLLKEYALSHSLLTDATEFEQ
jgi:iron complex transport system ATP-binding protein